MYTASFSVYDNNNGLGFYGPNRFLILSLSLSYKIQNETSVLNSY